MSITRRQHYVWKHYLEGWSTDGTIAVKRKGRKSFRANPINVGLEKDFYRLPILTDEDIDFIRRYVAEFPNQELRDLVADWLDLYCLPTKVRRILTGMSLSSEEIDKATENALIQAEESMHSYLEGDSVDLLAQLRDGDDKLWDDDDLAEGFVLFLSFQHTRTKKIRDTMLTAARTDEEREAVSRRFPVIRAMTATALGWSILIEKQAWRLRILKATGSLEFITSDQPTRNLLEPKGKNDLAIYYPVSPQVAVLLEHKLNPSAIASGDALDDCEVRVLNELVVDYCHEQIFGTNTEYLEKLWA